MRDDPTIASVRAQACTVPTDAPETDGTLSRDRTTFVVVHAGAGGPGCGLKFKTRDVDAHAV